MESKKSNILIIVLLFIIAFLTVALIVMLSLFFFSDSRFGGKTADVKSERLLKDGEWDTYKLYEENMFFNLKKSNSSSNMPLIKVGVEIRYFKKVKGVRSMQEKLDAHSSKMKEIVGTYFQNMTLEEAMRVETKEKARQDLIKQLNDLLNASEDVEKEFIFDVVFDEWFYNA